MSMSILMLMNCNNIARLVLNSARHLSCSKRHLSTTFTPVELASQLVEPVNGNDGEPLVILHGLFGSKRNWASIARQYANTLDRPVYTLDLRNHGVSPHAEPMNYRSMAHDVSEWIAKRNFQHVSVLGHSMGGKVAMTLALSTPELINRLVVVDIAPIPGRISPIFTHYLNGMRALARQGHMITSRKEATAFIAKYEPDPIMQAFLLTNLSIPPKPAAKPDHPAAMPSTLAETVKWTIPVDLIHQSLEDIGAFPYEPGEATFTQPTLFIRGSESRYIKPEATHIIQQFFPEAEIETIKGASHWVHVDKPAELQARIAKFFESTVPP